MHPPAASPLPERGRLRLENGPGTSAGRDLVMALSVQAGEYPERFDQAVASGFALEYTPDPLKPELVAPQVAPCLGEGVPVRFHCRFGQHELGNADRTRAGPATGAGCCEPLGTAVAAFPRKARIKKAMVERWCPAEPMMLIST